ncbi:hypothetical protein EV130_10841 [Rhizobium azibense]|uniref:Uncharacterized protein n=1 Tax=Rhizobium azibense TaxID=1136135 RepID=A0A4R3QP86_9HYPH|nr:hypothetical protein EV130_10841 [Rhizobium azibense]
MRTLKQEEVDGQAYRGLDHERTRIGEFSEAVCNRQRLALDYLAPELTEPVSSTRARDTKCNSQPG